MKKLLAFAIAGMFSISAAAYACDGAKQATKSQKTETAKVAKKETKTPAKAATKKS
jgi:hypothetical protein